MKKIVILITILPFLIFSQSKEYYAGIEIGGKGMKITILQLLNLKNGSYNVIDSWSENIPISKNISKEGVISEDDMIFTLNLLKQNYDNLRYNKSIKKDNIYVVVSSGVGIALNINDFLDKINRLLHVKSKVISVEEEIKLMIIGGIPFKKLNESIAIDVGGSNTKGGYLIDNDKEKNDNFLPINSNYGTVTLTEKIKKNLINPDDFNEFMLNSKKFSDSIKQSFKTILSANSIFNRRNNLYFSGGTIWAFITLSQNKDKNDYKIFSLEEVKSYQKDLIFNFEKFQKLSYTNPDVKKVLDTYSRQYLISGNIILLNIMENINNIETKNIYFVSNGHLSWLKAYILETKKHTDKELKNSKYLNPKNIVTFKTSEF
jgi:exopolyphosphatase/pppGpp-phosphohydrolase